MARLQDILNGVDLNTAKAQELSRALNIQQSVVRTDDQLRATAEQSVGSLYNQKNLSAQQQYDRAANSLRTQLDSLGDTFNQQREDAAANTRQNVSQTDRQMLSRGMGRSSYGLATVGNVRVQGEKTQDRINTAQTHAANEINSRLALADQQLGELLASYAVDKETDLLARMDELRMRDQADARATTEYNNSLILQLANMIAQQQAQEFEQDMARQQLELQRAALYAQGGSGGGSSYSGPRNTPPAKDKTNTIPTPVDVPRKTTPVVGHGRFVKPPPSAPAAISYNAPLANSTVNKTESSMMKRLSKLSL